MTCASCDADPRGVCFKHKIKTLQFGMVPGAYRQLSSTSYYDKQSLADQGFNFSEQEVKDTRSDFIRGVREFDEG